MAGWRSCLAPAYRPGLAQPAAVKAAVAEPCWLERETAEATWHCSRQGIGQAVSMATQHVPCQAQVHGYRTPEDAPTLKKLAPQPTWEAAMRWLPAATVSAAAARRQPAQVRAETARAALVQAGPVREAGSQQAAETRRPVAAREAPAP